eukprot:CAMPEP_0194501920 /NCGR_PEP_ID=MMETSP0253-20130528/23632_1 /TAXON_ID=2966 /ORGANISM="Noctiluca scintillans" /LENGTH=207 /DNA_ID=CAMNT_0039343975 /DNA_START=68 /DNA_END=691 /DNA_ORIENTATION=+
MAVIEEVDDDDDVVPEPATEQEAKPVAQAPEAPGLSLSQIVPMIVMVGMQKFDLEKLGYTRHVEVAFVVVQVICLTLLAVIYNKIQSMDGDGAKIHIPEVKQFGQVVTPSTEQTPKEYDSTKLMEQGKQSVMGCVISGGLYFYMGYLTPLILQVPMTFLQLIESPLFKIHMFGKAVLRPFPTPSPFGLPSTPEPAETVELQDDKKDK